MAPFYTDFLYFFYMRTIRKSYLISRKSNFICNFVPIEIIKMKKKILLVLIPFVLIACHESLEDRAAREAKEYTEKYCPTPVNNSTRTDSVIFDKATRTYHYYCTLTGIMDSAVIINKNKSKINDGLLQSITKSTNIKAYKEAGFNFAYTCRSQKNPRLILFEGMYTQKDYDK